MSNAPNIPEPSSVPVLGNLLHVDSDTPVASFAQLAQTHGPIFRMRLPGVSFLILGNHALVDEACDTTRFKKTLGAPVAALRAAVGDGLFTAYNDEPNWELAHRILMPAFSLEAMRGYHDKMLDVCVQMVDRWSRLRPEESVDVPDDMTRLTLDVIALCGFDYRLNSFYQDEKHPFVQSMERVLSEAMQADRRPDVVKHLMWRTRQRFEQDITQMHELVDTLIRERRALGSSTEPVSDLLGLMLEAKDPVTGQGLSDENIRFQILTFLAAGHETTSSLLAFTLYSLARNPEVYDKATQEVDRVVGGPEHLPSYENLGQMTYLEQILKESLRLWPTAPVFMLESKERTTLGGQWTIEAGETLMVLLGSLHRDPVIWEDPERFDPERFAHDQVAARPLNAWKPFGNGMRACIGRQFAMQEAKLALALILQRFSLTFEDPGYELHVLESLTLKPKNLRLKLHLRPGRSVADILSRTSAPAEAPQNEEPERTQVTAHGGTMLIGFGSNMGTTRQLAQGLGARARRLGYDAEVAPLDTLMAQDLKAPDVLLILTASYNGFPPDNAAEFCRWVDTLPSGTLEGVDYMVFGCGHSDWAATFQSVPRQLDAALEAAGATKLGARAEGNAAKDLVGTLETWEDVMWPIVHEHAGVTEKIQEVTLDRQASLEVELLEVPQSHSQDAKPMPILANRELVDMSAPFARSKRHIEFKLPEDQTYRAGDHLIVHAANAPERVERWAGRLDWDLEQVVVLQAQDGAPSTLPVGRPISLRALLTRHFELARPVYHRHLRALLEHTPCPPEKARLTRWIEDKAAFEAELEKHSLLDLLELLPSCNPPIELVLASLEPLTPRIYSIASAPEIHPEEVHLTVSVLDVPAASGQGRHLGVCSTWLAARRPGDTVWACVRTPEPAFALGDDTERAHIMIGAGTGYAPFRGFLQQRAAQRDAGRTIGPIAVFSGCDHEDVDLLYADELRAWEQEGLLELFVASSQSDGEVRFVQHRLWAEREHVGALLEQGADIFVCGDGRYMAPAVREVLQRIYADTTGANEEETARWWQACLEGSGSVRFFEDAWAG